MIHSEQSAYYTSTNFQKLVKDRHLRQSMPRRANCWDKAPQESFFGHMKDEIQLQNCITFDDVFLEIDNVKIIMNHKSNQVNITFVLDKWYSSDIALLRKNHR